MDQSRIPKNSFTNETIYQEKSIFTLRIGVSEKLKSLMYRLSVVIQF